MKRLAVYSALISVTVLAGCASEPDEYEVKSYASMANPAAVYCVQKGGELETVTEDAQRVTYCLLPQGERKEQWEYYRSQQKSNHQS